MTAPSSPAAGLGSVETAEAGLPPASRPRHRLRRILVGLGVCAVALATIAAADTQALLVLRDGRHVVVTHLLTPGWTALDRTTVSDVDVSYLPDDDRARVQRGVPVWGRSSADARLTALRADALQCKGSLIAPCPGQTLTVPTFLVAPESYPHGNRVKLTWSAPDRRSGATTSLRFLTKVAGSATDCPAVITAAGSCEAKVGFNSKVVAGLTVTAPRSTTRTAKATGVALAKPKIIFKAGKIFVSDNRHVRTCSIDISVRGYQRFSAIKVSYSDGDEYDGPSRFTPNWVRVATDDRGDADVNTLDADAHGYSGYEPGKYTITVTVGKLKAVNHHWTCRTSW